jgi:hypothetical protein
LSPIPLKPEKKPSEMEREKLIPIPKAKPQIEPIVIEESQDIPIITEKRKVTSIVTEKQLEEPETEKIKLSPFSIEKPKISSVSIEEIEEESIKSSSSDLFNVFSSIGSKSSEKADQKIESAEQIVEDVKNKIQAKKTEIVNTPENENLYVIFNEGVPKSQIKPNTSTQDDINSDKDSLYQELIALEGKRYALEKVDKDLKERYSKGSLSDLEFKNQSINLENQLEAITTRIHNIRRLISSL